SLGWTRRQALNVLFSPRQPFVRFAPARSAWRAQRRVVRRLPKWRDGCYAARVTYLAWDQLGRSGSALVATVLALGCTGETSPTGGPPASDPPSVCADDSRWVAPTIAFRDATSAFGLSALHAEGARISAVDFDGDGYPDLVVRRAAAYDGDDFAP